ncbi:MAG: ATP-binding protein [Bacteroidota bacterium]
MNTNGFHDQHQNWIVIRLDQSGKVLHSTGQLVELPPNADVSQVTFLESVWNEVTAIPETNNPLIFNCVECNFWGREGLFDFQFFGNDWPEIELRAYDNTIHYNQVREMQQSRNESRIESEQARKRNRALEAERKAAENELAETQAAARLRTEMFARISHDMRVPLNNIIGLTRLMTMEQVGDPEYLAALEVSSNQLEALLNDIMDFSKIENGEISFNPIPTSLSNLARELILSFQFQAREKGIELFSHVSAELAAYHNFDPVRLRQVLANLISNAVKFTSAGSVSLKFEVLESAADRQTLKFSVRDTGIGIAETELERVFQPYKQEAASTYQEYGGTGLGLPIVKHLVEQQGGTVHVASNKGTGTVFEIVLEYPTAHKPGEGEDAAKLEGAQILLVEDNPMNQRVLSAILARVGCETTVANSAETALELLAGGRYDLIILDYNLPGMNGADLARTIRDRCAPDVPPLIGSSGSDDPTFQAEVDGVIRKPARPDDLINMMRLQLQDRLNDTFAFDISYLQEASGGDAKLLQEMIGIFVGDTPVAIDRLLAFCQQDAYQSLAEEIHRIKSNFHYIGSKELILLAEEIESLARKEADAGELLPKIQQLQEISTRIINQLKSSQ